MTTLLRTGLPMVGREGILDFIWAVVVKEYEELEGVDLDRQAADGVMGKAPLWGLVGPNRTGRAKNDVKHSLLVEDAGGPLSLVIARADGRHDKR